MKDHATQRGLGRDGDLHGAFTGSSRVAAWDEGYPIARRAATRATSKAVSALVFNVFVQEEKSMADPTPRVAVLMGSKNDWEQMKPAVDALESLGVSCDVRVTSAHRTPGRHASYVESAPDAGIEIFICGAGFAAALAGVTAALTPLPVLGVPLDSSSLDGLDALLSTVQMPGGIPVATFAIGRSGAKNAGLFAGAILAGRDPEVREKLDELRARQTADVPETPFD
jgi:5-(carboxyamino)imidazole ribonucleotide mutase